MANNQSAKGQCLCGKVQIEASSVSNQLHACHCDMCRRWAGGPAMAVDCGQDVKFNSQDNINLFSSSDWAERGFCKNCGTHLFYRLKQSGQYIMPVALFDGLEGVEFESQIFIDEKPDYYEFANQTQKLTGEQVFASFNQPES